MPNQLFEDFELVRLNSETNILPFDCGDTDLNGFFIDDAKNYLTQLLAVTYIIHNTKDTIAYFNFINDKISHTEVGSIEKFFDRIGSYLPSGKSKYKSYPAVKIGRLAVNSNYQSRGLGGMILDYAKQIFVTNNRTGCKFLTVDAYRQSLKFYEKHGFNYLTSKDRKSDTRLMYFNLESIA